MFPRVHSGEGRVVVRVAETPVCSIFRGNTGGINCCAWVVCEELVAF